MSLEEKATKRLEHLVKILTPESERTQVIIIAGHIDALLTQLLEARLVPWPRATDPLFQGPNAMLGNFSNKIDLSYRLGLISQRLSKALHIVRKIRNEFAHSIDGVSLEAQSISAQMANFNKLVPGTELIPIMHAKVSTSAKAHTNTFFINMIMAVVALEGIAHRMEPIAQAPEEAICGNRG